MIHLRDIRYCYPNSEWALQGLDFSIGEGEYILVCGANGSGKSTLVYLLNGLIPHFFGGRLQGTVEVGGASTVERPVSELFSLVGLVFVTLGFDYYLRLDRPQRGLIMGLCLIVLLWVVWRELWWPTRPERGPWWSMRAPF